MSGSFAMILSLLVSGLPSESRRGIPTNEVVEPAHIDESSGGTRMQQAPIADIAVVPDWIEAFITAIDAKKFDTGFDKLGADVPWSYGIVEGRGAKTLAALFRKTVEGVDTKHRIVSCWRGPGVVIARGLAETTPRDGSGTRPGPFVWIFYMDKGHEDRVARFFIVVGPVRTHPFP